MRLALVLPWLGLVAACASQGQARVAHSEVPLWRYRVKDQADGSRLAVAVDECSGKEEALPQGLWCPHGAIIELKRDDQGKVVGAESQAEPVEVESCFGTSFMLRDGFTAKTMQVEGPGKILPAFALAPAQGQVRPWVVWRWQVADGRADWAVLDRAHGHVAFMGPWQIEHIQFQRMERPGKGLENCLLFAFQAGEGSQVCVVKVEVGAQGARLRPRTEEDAANLRHFLGRATPGEKEVVEKILAD